MKISENLSKLEMACFIFVIIGAALNYTAVDSLVLKLSLGSLAITFFAHAFVVADNGHVAEIEEDEDVKSGFSNLFSTTILPKVLWISTAVLTVGFLLYFVEAKGYKNLFYNGVATSMICMVTILLFVVKGTRNININYPILLRAVPVLLTAIYILFR